MRKIIKNFVFVALICLCISLQVACNFGGNSKEIEEIKNNWSNAFNLEEGGALENVTILVEGSISYPRPENGETVQTSQVIGGLLKKDKDMYYLTPGNPASSIYAQKVTNESGKTNFRYAMRRYDQRGGSNYVWEDVFQDDKEYASAIMQIVEEELRVVEK